MNKVFGSITATIGNLAAGKDRERTEIVLEHMFFINTAIYGYICIGMLVLLKEFVTQIWLTSEYNLTDSVIVLALTELFLRSIHYPLYTTRNAMGYFSQYKSVFVGAAILNIALDFALVKPLGIAGLFIATIICRLITYLVDIYVVYHEGFNSSVSPYIVMVLKWLVFLAACGFASRYVIRIVSLQGIVGFVLRMVVITVVYFVMFLISFGKSDELKYFIGLLKNMLRRHVA